MDADGQINESHAFLTSAVQASLSKLLETLRKAEPFFVRCIRSNADKVSDELCYYLSVVLFGLRGKQVILFFICWHVFTEGNAL